MSLITVEGIRVYAYHGHLPEEATLGGHFIINVWVETDTSQVEVSDNLKDTVDYVALNAVKTPPHLSRIYVFYLARKLCQSKNTMESHTRKYVA